MSKHYGKSGHPSAHMGLNQESYVTLGGSDLGILGVGERSLSPQSISHVDGVIIQTHSS